jgi:hypothetical protein
MKILLWNDLELLGAMLFDLMASEGQGLILLRSYQKEKFLIILLFPRDLQKISYELHYLCDTTKFTSPNNNAFVADAMLSITGYCEQELLENWNGGR